jgi:transcriptional regulator with XRE-family HTH domain
MKSDTGNPVDKMVGGHLKTERKRAGLSALNVCRIIGVDELRYLRFESGHERIDARSLRKICLALGVSPIVFFTEPPQAAGFESTAELKWMC